MRHHETVAVLECSECMDVWLPEDDARWRAYFDRDGYVTVFCPECAQTGFGDALGRRAQDTEESP